MSVANPMVKSDQIQIYVYTNRGRLGLFPACTNSYYGTDASPEAAYLSCGVGVPMKHAVGAIDVGENQSNPDLHFISGDHRTYDHNQFFEALKQSGKKEVLLFIHGFNVKFEEALYRTAQIAYDLKFQGIPILLSWPAGPANGLLEGIALNRTYEKNTENATRSVTFARDFIRDLRELDLRIFVIVHSMGHQVALPALYGIGMENSEPFIEELILHAPDYPIEGLRKQSETIGRIAKRITMYCSPADNALLASKQMNGNTRAGLCTRIDNIDVVNVNEVDDPVLGIGGLGHGYYSGRPILTDMMQILLGINVEKRLFIRRSGPGNAEDFVMRR
jgi:esterase/lipase superfamily enzyme